MAKKTKRLIATILATLLLTAFCSAFLQAYAWTNISSATTSFSILSGTGHVSCGLSAYKHVTKVSIEANLQQKVSGKWTTIKTWTASANDTYVDLVGSKALAKGTYRLEAIYTAKSSSLTEVHTTYSPERVY